jgi:hypothetical protein
MRFGLEFVDLMPSVLEPGIVYFSDEFEIAIHLCACGCGAKISTPIGPTEWSIQDSATGPTLYPSIGNWQLPCKSHYFIRRGEVVWAPAWTHDNILAGREEEARRRSEYYGGLYPEQRGFRRLWYFIKQKILNWLHK